MSVNKNAYRSYQKVKLSFENCDYCKESISNGMNVCEEVSHPDYYRLFVHHSKHTIGTQVYKR